MNWLYLTQGDQVSEEQWAGEEQAVGEPGSQQPYVPEKVLEGQRAVSQYWAPAEVQNLPLPGLGFLICKMASFLWGCSGETI